MKQETKQIWQDAARHAGGLADALDGLAESFRDEEPQLGRAVQANADIAREILGVAEQVLFGRFRGAGGVQ